MEEKMQSSTNQNPNNSAKVRKIAGNVGYYMALCVFSLFFLFPFFIMVSRSFMSDDEILGPVKLLPVALDFSIYFRIFDLKMVYWVMNTFLIAVINIVGITLSSSLCAYGFAKLNFKLKNFWFAVVMATLMLPGITTQIPLYILYSKLNWTGTWRPLTLPGFFGGGAINIFLMRQFMRGIPNQILESAKIDGANRLVIYVRMVLPLCLPILTYVMVTVFLGQWNDFMGPLMYLGASESKFTISLALYRLFRAGSTVSSLPNSQMAAGVIMMLPCMVIFFVFQKQLINGVATSGIKG